MIFLNDKRQTTYGFLRPGVLYLGKWCNWWGGGGSMYSVNLETNLVAWTLS